MNESSCYVKCEKPQQPENNENCGDDPKHLFFSLLLNAWIFEISAFRSSPISLGAGTNLITEKKGGCSLLHNSGF
jgi:hypothetical protein